MDYKEFDTVPAYVRAIWENGKLMNRHEPVLWGSEIAPPPIGAKIVVTINGCGPAIVTGYFVEGGYLGLMCRLTNPPEWHKKQNKGNKNGHVFGPEFKMA